jgi:hypothetical protein
VGSSAPSSSPATVPALYQTSRTRQSAEHAKFRHFAGQFKGDLHGLMKREAWLEIMPPSEFLGRLLLTADAIDFFLDRQLIQTG